MEEWTSWHERHKDKIEIIAGVDCWIWTAARTGGKKHGRVRYGKSGERYSEYAHRAAFMEFNGYMPPKGQMVCHKCGVGLCVRPSHLYNGNAETNGFDMSVMGTGAGKLTYNDAYEIRVKYKNGSKIQDIADEYGLAFGSVYPIVAGKSYRHAPFPENYSYGDRLRKPLTEGEVLDIRQMLLNGCTQREIAGKHNVARSIISRINTGDRHKNK